MRSNYWSCTKLADWVRGTKKISSGTSREWSDWRKAAESFSGIRYWLAEEGLDMLQDIWKFIPDKLDAFSYWVHNRFVTQTHCLKSDLEKGKWHEFDERLLHSAFTELQEFVEVDKAWMNWDSPHRPWWMKKLPYFIKKLVPFRSQQLGVEYLIWEISLRNDCRHYGYDSDDQVPAEYKNAPEWGKLTRQAISAFHQLELYCWWKFIRPNRPDPYEVSGYNAYWEKYKSVRDMLDFEDHSPEEKQERESCSKRIDTIETAFAKEDDDMLHLLVKIRKELWT